jgi:negative regulator of sigma E activity
MITALSIGVAAVVVIATSVGVWKYKSSNKKNSMPDVLNTAEAETISIGIKEGTPGDEAL